MTGCARGRRGPSSLLACPIGVRISSMSAVFCTGNGKSQRMVNALRGRRE